MSQRPLHHIVRVRSTEDLQFVNPGLMDEVVINANQLENDVQSAAVSLWKTTVPFAVDPVLWRFQVPEWWKNDKGATKKNYGRLGLAYAKGTRIPIATVPLVDAVEDDEEWRLLATNVVDYQRSRLLGIPARLSLWDDDAPLRDLHPVRIFGPALVANSAREDRINNLLFEASAAAVGGPIAAQVIVPHDRLLDADSLKQLVESLPRDGVSSYFVWTPKITEELLLGSHAVFVNVLTLIAALAARGIPVGHQHGNYSIAAMHDFGLDAVTHHLGWVDHGEPAEQPGFARRSCRTYVPGVRHCLYFDRAGAAGRHLDRDQYSARYCECPFCLGVFDEMGKHPLDLLLEDKVDVDRRGRSYHTPTSRAVASNTFHYLWSRHLEIRAFSELPSSDVVRRDLDRAGLLLDGADSAGLRHLADELRTA